MIRNEKEYKEAVERLLAEKERLDQHRESLIAEGLGKSAIKNLLDPMISFHLQLQEEVEGYRHCSG